ncbi:Uncharacterized protein involved in exopolysaccharide biosynthesis [Devosia sp. YR412]|uniref:GumC family protein n=1 Tax=Devosia sp. YR412 TaxID=1881030 RepID=UPI0008AC7D02|nr:GumC family protein [Devosia sp. YR412]SEQ56972.1 Uncharacterized protein involved in exopolysaccharide biosynthesis [Devosia sp. YR412]
MTYESPEAQEARIDVAAMLRGVVQRLPRILLVTLALLAATFVLLMFVPRTYDSSATILVEPRGNVYSRAINEQAPSLSGGEAGVVSSQMGLIRSRDTLLKVIDQLDLRSVPEFNGASGGFSPMSLVSRMLGRGASTPVSIDETVLNALYERLNVAQDKDSRLIVVTVSSTDPDLAAEIANAVANAHVARRAELSLSDTAEASSWLADEIAKLRVTVTEAETAVANFKVDNDLFIGSNNTSLADQQLSTIASQISAAQERKSTAESKAALIRGMIDRGQSIEGVADVRDSAVILQLTQEKARLQGEKAQRSATLLANHPTVQALTAQIAELDNQITIEGRGVANALDAQAQIEAGIEASLQADLTRAKSSSSTVTQDTVTLDALEREATAQRNLLEGYLQRYSEAVSRTDSNSALPDVRVVSVAAPSVTPASPKVTLMLIAVGFVSVAVQIGIVIFGELMSGRAMVRVERPQDELEEELYADDELVAEDTADYQDAEPVVVAVVSDIEPVHVAPEPVEEPVAAAPAAERQPALQRFRQAFARSAKTEAVESTESAAPTTTVFEHMAPPPAPARPSIGLVRLADLASDLVLGRTHLVVLAAHNANADCEILAEQLIDDALARGLSVALIDAGSARPGDAAGLTDLSTDAASFGDVVHKSADNSFAEVPWGRARAISRSSVKPLTLVEALGDIYEVVVLMTGRVGMTSSLPFFDGLDGRLVLVAGPEDDLNAVAQTRQLLLDAGFERCEVAAAPARVAA